MYFSAITHAISINAASFDYAARTHPERSATESKDVRAAPLRMLRPFYKVRLCGH
jgi:hypothetical protein